jgi:tetratricopeptide (TPR) repeat protein
MVEKIDGVFEPFTTAQMNIRNEFLPVIYQNYDNSNPSMVKLLNTAFFRADEYASRVPLDLEFSSNLAFIYTVEGSNINDHVFFEKGENYFRKIISFAPNKPDINYHFALNLFYQNKFDESFSYFEKAFNADPSLYQKDGKIVEGMYTIFLEHFYQTKDKANFTKAAQRLEENGYTNKAVLNQVMR